ncbi:DUF4062 domain-containing protein [Gynuella sp.]|uniref:DUF4062 domain-containing protein n=1 Tax=Gynuella sp. TaxID=2969146 RepID=UPI003D1139A7
MSDLSYQVMVGSTQADLSSETRMVQECLVAQGANVSGFSFPKHTDNYLWKLNLNCLNNADYLYLIVGHQYGPLSPTGVGYMHRLFASAQATNKPIVSLIYNGQNKPYGNAADKTRLHEFVNQLKMADHYFWHDQSTLLHATETSYELMLDKAPARGWVRPEHVSKHSGQEVNILRRQIALLKKEMEQLRQNRLQPLFDQKVTLPYQCKCFYGGTLKTINHHTEWSLDEIFLAIAPIVMDEQSEAKVRSSFFDQVLDQEKPALGRMAPEAHAFVDLKIPQNTFYSIKVLLRSYGLVAVRKGAWKLTPYGEQCALNRVEVN